MFRVLSAWCLFFLDIPRQEWKRQLCDGLLEVVVEGGGLLGRPWGPVLLVAETAAHFILEPRVSTRYFSTLAEAAKRSSRGMAQDLCCMKWGQFRLLTFKSSVIVGIGVNSRALKTSWALPTKNLGL